MVVALAAGLALGTFSADAGDQAATAEYSRIIERVARLEADRTERTAAAASSSGARHAPDDRARADGPDVQRLREDLAAVRAYVESSADAPIADDVAHLMSLPNLELSGEFQKRLALALRNKQVHPGAVVDAHRLLRAADVLLARDLGRDERVGTLVGRARALYWTLAERDQADATLQEALRAAGTSVRLQGMVKAQLGHSAARNGDHRSAAEWYLAVADHPETHPILRAQYRTRAAYSLERIGESSAAREQHERVLELHGASDDAGVQRFVELSRTALRESAVPESDE